MSLDLGAYLARIGLDAAPAPDAEGLARLHEAHALSIPFENVEVIAGRSPSLDLAAIEAKLVGGGRGGYCFEHALLFHAALEAVGLAPRLVSARVRMGATSPTPRTHAAMLVETEAGTVVADVGFGGAGLLRPVPLGGESAQGLIDFRTVETPQGWMMQGRIEGAWSDLYLLDLGPTFPIDYLVSNHFVSTHPRSPFVNGLYCARISRTERIALRGRVLSVRTQAGETSREIGPEELPELLSERIGLRLPPADMEAALASLR